MKHPDTSLNVSLQVIERARAGLVAGIDVGTLSSPSFVAWLVDREFILDLYQPTIAAPLPIPPKDLPPVISIALDVPQGLPADLLPRRKADVEANTPTRVLPSNRLALSTLQLYGGLVRAGVEMFWSIHENELGDIVGLRQPTSLRPIVMETYPRYVIKRLWSDLKIPSKRKAPLDYVDAVWKRLGAAGYSCASVVRPTVDQIDAMICALAAQAAAMSDDLPAGTVGTLPQIDLAERTLREGLIVSP